MLRIIKELAKIYINNLPLTDYCKTDILNNEKKIIIDFEETEISPEKAGYLSGLIEACILENLGSDWLTIISGNKISISPQLKKEANFFSGRFTSIDEVSQMVAIGSAKGGVGKSTVAFLLAKALSQAGHSVGLADLDISGSSIPIIAECNEKTEANNGKFTPLIKDGIRIISIQSITKENGAIVWRGAMLYKAIHAMLRGTNWGKLDYLILDLPPGTNDVHISLYQHFPVDLTFAIKTPHPITFHGTQKFSELLKHMMVKYSGDVVNMAPNSESDFHHNNKQNMQIQANEQQNSLPIQSLNHNAISNKITTENLQDSVEKFSTAITQDSENQNNNKHTTSIMQIEEESHIMQKKITDSQTTNNITFVANILNQSATNNIKKTIISNDVKEHTTTPQPPTEDTMTAISIPLDIEALLMGQKFNHKTLQAIEKLAKKIINSKP